MYFGRGRSRDRSRGHGSVLWTPLLRSELWSWLRADAVDAATISTATDKSGLDHNATAAGGARPTQVASVYGGRPSMRFAGAQKLSISGLTLSTFTIAAVWRMSGTAGLLFEHGPNVVTGSGTWLYGAGASALFTQKSGVLSSKTRAALTDNGMRITRLDYDGTHAGHVLRTFGALEALTNAGGTSNPGSLASVGAQALSIGARTDLTFGITGDLCELLVFTPQLPAGVAAQLDAYLCAYYGETLIPDATEVVMLGDSTTAAIAGTIGAATVVYANRRNPTGTRVVSLAVAGDTIQAQRTAWEGSSYVGSSAVKLVTILCGLNNLAAEESSSTILGRLAGLTASIKASNPSAKIALYTITPARVRWDDVFGAGARSNAVQATWTAVNAAIAAGSVANADYARTAPATTVDDGTGALGAAYELAAPDHIHWNTSARTNVYATDVQTVAGLVGAA